MRHEPSDQHIGCKAEMSGSDWVVDVWTWKLVATKSQFQGLAALLNAEELDRASRFVHSRDTEKFIIGRGQMRNVLCRYLDTAPAEVDLRSEPEGKPFVASEKAAGLSFNLSHSGSLAALAVSWRWQVGIDIERIQAFSENVSERYFSSAELQALALVGEEDRWPAFFRCWTRKEAFIKGLGQGLEFPLGSFDVSIADNPTAPLLSVRGSPDLAEQWTFLTFKPAPDYEGAVAVRCGREAASMSLRTREL